VRSSLPEEHAGSNCGGAGERGREKRGIGRATGKERKRERKGEKRGEK